jgi:hypothetical protein
MTFEFGIHTESRHVTPHGLRTSAFVSLHVGRLVCWVQRWRNGDVHVKPGTRIIHRGKVMTWNCGRYRV